MVDFMWQQCQGKSCDCQSSLFWDQQLQAIKTKDHHQLRSNDREVVPELDTNVL